MKSQKKGKTYFKKYEIYLESFADSSPCFQTGLPMLSLRQPSWISQPKTSGCYSETAYESLPAYTPEFLVQWAVCTRKPAKLVPSQGAHLFPLTEPSLHTLQPRCNPSACLTWPIATQQPVSLGLESNAGQRPSRGLRSQWAKQSAEKSVAPGMNQWQDKQKSQFSWTSCNTWLN